MWIQLELAAVDRCCLAPCHTACANRSFVRPVYSDPVALCKNTNNILCDCMLVYYIQPHWPGGHQGAGPVWRTRRRTLTRPSLPKLPRQVWRLLFLFTVNTLADYINLRRQQRVVCMSANSAYNMQVISIPLRMNANPVLLVLSSCCYHMYVCLLHLLR